MNSLLLAFQFLTIIPLRVKGDVFEKQIAQSAVFFPFVGAAQGLMAVLAASLLRKGFSPDITAGFVILLLILSNGGFHLDGLADTFDALSVKATGNAVVDKEKRLSVMKDSTTGAIGVVAIIMVLLLKFAFINNLLGSRQQAAGYCWLFLMPVFSKWVMVPAMYHGAPAREDGLGRIFLNNTTLTTVALASVPVIVFYLLSARFCVSAANQTVMSLCFAFIAITLYVFCYITAMFCRKKFEGLTGDNLGAISEASEIIFLTTAYIWLQHFIW